MNTLMKADINKKVRVKYSLPQKLYEKLKMEVSLRERSKFVTEAVTGALKNLKLQRAV